MTTIYFGYGSNLWKHQMLQRCPTSQYLGIARLSKYKWIINNRGYANIVELQNPAALQSSIDHSTETWGLVYSLQRSDEDQLDINEGVPESYTKEYLMVDFWPKGRLSGVPDPSLQPEKVRILVYIDRLRLEPDEPKKEYILRMNKGISDAVRDGMPVDYVENVLRRFIPDVREEDLGVGVEELARKQAMLFEDER